MEESTIFREEKARILEGCRYACSHINDQEWNNTKCSCEEESIGYVNCGRGDY